ncbi:MAG: motility associated factor glycosyltransferase family protein [Planctomycetota bacterium]|jgi:hypothetical protein
MPEIATKNVDVAAGRALFLKNMAALWRHDPVMALAIDAIDDDRRLELEPTRSGAVTAQAPAPDGNFLFLHSRYDPAAEATKLVDTIDLDEKYAFVVSGLGLGYHVLDLYHRLSGDAIIICIEPSLETIATAMTCLDFSEAISRRKLILLTSDDKTRLHDRLYPHSTLMMLGMEFVRLPPAIKISGTVTNRVLDAIKEFVTFTRMSLLTLVTNSRITCQNIAMNLVSYLTTPPIDDLHNRFRGDPAIIVSAGPSLRGNIEQIVELKGKAVVCAVQTSVKPLMKHGIVPDFITSLDFHEMSRGFYEHAGDLSGAHLVAEPKATWHVIDNFPGRVSLLDNTWAHLVLGEEIGRRGGLKAGATVAHLAFYLAQYMGCDPIIFVGQDLGYTGHVFYTPGVEIHQSWRSELNRFHSIEHMEWEKIVRNRKILHRIPGNDGHDIYTDELLLTYLEQFEKDFAETSRHIINATEGGARIRGTEVMTLADAASKFCQSPIDRERFAYRRREVHVDSDRLRQGAREIKTRLEELDGATAVCDELLQLLDELQQLVDDPQHFNRRLVRVDELRTRISRESRTYHLINAAGQLAELRRFSADRKIRATKPDEKDRAQQQLRRDIEFISAIKDGAADVRGILTKSLQRVEDAISRS